MSIRSVRNKMHAEAKAKGHLKLVVNNKNVSQSEDDDDDIADLSKKINKQILDGVNAKIAAKANKHKIMSVTDRAYMEAHKHADLILPTLESKFDKVLTRKNLKVQKKVAGLTTTIDFRPDFYVPEKKMFVVVFTIWTLYEESKAVWKINRRIARQVVEEAEVKIKWSVVDHFHNKTTYFILPKDWYEMDYKELRNYCRNAKWKKGAS